MAHVGGHLPPEIAEKIIKWFLLTTDPNVKNRGAIARVCRMWREIAEPLLYQHVVIFDNHDEFTKLQFFGRTLDRHPEYAAGIESLTLRFPETDHWVDMSDHETTHRFRLFKVIQNVKHLSINISVSHEYLDFHERWLIGKFIGGIPPSCQSFEFKVDNHYNSRRSYDTQRNLEDIYGIPSGLRSLRIEAPVGYDAILRRLGNRVFESLENVVVKSDKLDREYDLQAPPTSMLPRVYLTLLARQVVKTVRKGTMPALKRLLLYFQAYVDDFDIGTDLDNRLEHARELSHHDIHRLLFAEGVDADEEDATNQANRVGEATGMGEDHEQAATSFGTKWLLFDNSSGGNQVLLGVVYIFSIYPVNLQSLEDHGFFSWSSTLNGVRLPVNQINAAEQIRSPTEISAGANVAMLPLFSNGRYSEPRESGLSVVLFEACTDLAQAVSD